MNLGEKIRQARKEKGMSQEILAESFGLSVQAVSKWECDLSYPDITLLPQIADFLEVSLDYLLRDEQNDRGAGRAVQLDLPEDDTLRIVQCIGRKIVSKEEWKQTDRSKKIPLYFDETWKKNGNKIQINMEIWGSADIDGSVSGDVHAGDGVNCGSVGNDVHAGDGVNCGSVGNDVHAGDGVNCGNVGKNVTAGDNVNCGGVGGDVTAGEIHCKTIKGEVKGGTIFYDV